MDPREFIAAAVSVAAASQAFAQMAAEEPMMPLPHYKALEGARKRGDVRRTKPVVKTHRQCEIQRSNQGKAASG